MALPDVTPESPRIKAALWFADHGFGVFSCWSAKADGTCKCLKRERCSSPGKHPITDNGFKDATTDPARIRTLLSAASEPNYGLVCPEGVFALDVDGDDWESRLAALEARYGPLPPTLRTETRNGQHVFLRWPAGLPRPLHRIFGWVTRWGSGSSKHLGYVIGPRSIHPSGFEYAPLGVFEVGTLPDAWAQAALAEGDHAPGTITVGGEQDPASVPVGGRHDYLRDRARFYAGSIRDPEALFGAVWALNEKLTQPKSREEVLRAIGDALIKYPADPVEEDPETGEVRVVRPPPVDELGILPPSGSDRFPDPPAGAAFGGLIGECVLELAEGTDASLAGILASMLAVCGAMVPATAHARGDQTSSPYLALVGESGTGRKGTAMNRAVGAARNIWGTENVNPIMLDGLNSGEALVSALHEQYENRYRKADMPVVGFVFEEEFVNMLASRGRENSTLDGKLRTAFDGTGSLSNRKAQDSKVVHPPYFLPALAAITPRELRTRLEAGSAQSGAANRWLYIPVEKRDVITPDEPPILSSGLTRRLKSARGDGHARHLTVDPIVSRIVSEYAEHVTTTSSGIARDLVRRYGTLAFRCALIHAAVEGSAVVTPEHMARAVALAEYARRGISWVFGQTIGNRDADLLLRHLQQAGALRKHVITRGIIRDSLRQQDAVDELVRLGYAEVTVATPERGGRITELKATGLGVSFQSFVPDVQGSRHTQAETHENLGRLDVRPPSEHETGPDGLDVRLDVRVNPVVMRDGRMGEWVVPCRDYDQHQNQHRQTPAGWLCDTCEEESPSGICPVCGIGPFLSVEFFDRHQAQAHP